MEHVGNAVVHDGALDVLELRDVALDELNRSKLLGVRIAAKRAVSLSISKTQGRSPRSTSSLTIQAPIKPFAPVTRKRRGG